MTTITQHMMALAWLTGMMVSPEALVLHGNLTGTAGLGFMVPMAAVLALHALNRRLPSLIRADLLHL